MPYQQVRLFNSMHIHNINNPTKLFTSQKLLRHL